MLTGGVEIQIRLSGSDAVADGPYSFSSRFALVRTFSPAAIACAGPVICQASLKNNGGGTFDRCCAAAEASAKTANNAVASFFIPTPFRSPSTETFPTRPVRVLDRRPAV